MSLLCAQHVNISTVTKCTSNPSKDQLNHYGAFIKCGDDVTLGVIVNPHNFIYECN